jgi:hypothetical protein
MVYFMDTWSNLWSFVIFYEHLLYLVRGKLVYFFPVLVSCAKKYLATLVVVTTYVAIAGSNPGYNATPASK